MQVAVEETTSDEKHWLWRKGKSGNPSGKPKDPGRVELTKLAKTHTKQALERLVYWMNSDNAKASVTAAQVILDRGWGRPQQTVDAKVSLSFAELVMQSFKGDGAKEINPQVIENNVVAQALLDVTQTVEDAQAAGDTVDHDLLK